MPNNRYFEVTVRTVKGTTEKRYYKSSSPGSARTLAYNRSDVNIATEVEELPFSVYGERSRKSKSIYDRKR